MTIAGRYQRQALFAEIGPAGQERLSAARVVVVGIGALGCQEAALLARAGVGRLRLVDRDFVEGTNLQRQILFDEEDARLGLPKAEAARTRLAAANSEIRIEAEVRDVTPESAPELLSDADVIVDGTDNFEVRYLLNDLAIREGIPWIYAAAVGASGLLLPVLPGETPCLRCLFEEPPPAGSADTCDTAGVLASATSAVGSLAALEALKIAAGRRDAVRRGLLQLDLWANELRPMSLEGPRPDCPCCGERRFPFLEVRERSATTRLCGRDAVQVTPSGGGFEYGRVRDRILGAVEGARDNGFLLRFESGPLKVTLFRDGRAIVKGTAEPDVARAAYARFVGA